MPRRSSGPRLWLDKKSGRNTYTIIDGRIRHRTGYTDEQSELAEKYLGDYIASKYTIKAVAAPFIADILNAYATEHLVHKVSGSHILYDIRWLAKWWGTERISEINAKTCRAYAAHRQAGPSARRELSFLRAALKFWHREHGPLTVVPSVVLPPKPSPRSNFMTRTEAAKFLFAARRTPHLARFFIVGWYSGSRRSVICGLKWSMVNLETGIMQRKERGEVETKKKAPRVKMGDRLLSHMRRWKRIDAGTAEYVVHFRGSKIDRPIRSWERVRRAANLPAYVVPHVLRHSRATTMLKAGIQPWEVANALGMSLQTLVSVYGHFHPDWQKDASNAR